MTEENHCYENTIAERVNGILKDVFYFDQTFDNVAHAKRTAKNTINLYNKIRLHYRFYVSDFSLKNSFFKNLIVIISV